MNFQDTKNYHSFIECGFREYEPNPILDKNVHCCLEKWIRKDGRKWFAIQTKVYKNPTSSGPFFLIDSTAQFRVDGQTCDVVLFGEKSPMEIWFWFYLQATKMGAGIYD